MVGDFSLISCPLSAGIAMVRPLFWILLLAVGVFFLSIYLTFSLPISPDNRLVMKIFPLFTFS